MFNGGEKLAPLSFDRANRISPPCEPPEKMISCQRTKTFSGTAAARAMRGNHENDAGLRETLELFAGYYQRPLHASVSAGGGVYQDNASGLVSATRVSLGTYDLVWEREVDNCTAAVADTIFADVREVSPDVTSHPAGLDSMTVVVRDGAGALADTYFEIRLTC